MKILVLGLGNELLSDDGVGLLAARRLRTMLDGQADVLESNLTGVALLEVLVGYDRAILIDAVQTGRFSPGTIVEIDPGQLRAVSNPSPHYTGIPEMIAIAKELNLQFSTEIRIMAVEIGCIQTIGETLSTPVADAIAELTRCIGQQLQLWKTRVPSRERCYHHA